MTKRIRLFIALLSTLLVAASRASAQTAAPIQPPRSDTPLVLEVSTLWDGRGQVLHNTRIVVADGKIVRIDPHAQGRLVDLRGLTVMPGWIDAHVHITYHFGPTGRFGEHEDKATADGEIDRNAQLTLAAGFTTVQSVGAPGDLALRQRIADGETTGPRILTAVRPITNPKLTPEQIRAAVREVKRQGGDLIKIFASESIRDGAGRTLSDEQLRAACGEATAEGLRSLVHAYKDAVRAATLAGCTEVEHGTLSTAADLQLMAARGTYFDPQAGLVIHNYLDNEPHFLGEGNFNEAGFAAMRQALPLNIALFKEALATPRLKLVFGTDAVAGAHGHNAEEFLYRVEAGQAPMAALETAQSRNAEALRMQGQIGAIAPGLDADIIALQGDPQRDITSVRRVAFVMRAGVVYKQPAVSQQPAGSRP